MADAAQWSITLLVLVPLSLSPPGTCVLCGGLTGAGAWAWGWLAMVWIQVK